MAGLLDFFDNADPAQKQALQMGLLNFGAQMMQNSAPGQQYRPTLGGAIGKSLPVGMQAYQQGMNQAALQKAIQADNPQDMMKLLGQVNDPAIQGEILKNRLSAMTPKYEVTKDAFGNPIAYNTLDPSKTIPMGGTGMFGGMGGSTGNSGTPGTDTSGTATGDEFLKTLPPQISTQVKSIAEGRMPFPGGMAMKTPYWQQMLQSVAQYDPTFDAVNYNARSKTRNDFTSGKSAQNITSMNTALGHINSLLDAGDALNNTDSTWLNTALNSTESAFGDPRKKTFETSRDAVADELTRVFRGTGGSAGDVQAWKEKLDSANSPEQFKAVSKQMAELLGSRLDALGAQYNQGMGTTKQGIDLLTPKAQAAYQRLAGEAPPRVNATGTQKTGSDQSGNKVTIPPASAISYLRSNPQAAADFEAKYGISAKTYLGL